MVGTTLNMTLDALQDRVEGDIGTTKSLVVIHQPSTFWVYMSNVKAKIIWIWGQVGCMVFPMIRFMYR